MEKFFLAVFAAFFEFFRGIIVVGLAVGIGILVAMFLCNIDPDDSYSWVSGIWHGLFVIPNYARGILDPDILYKALDYSSMYNVFWWIVVILQAPTFILLFLKVVISPIMAAYMVASDT